MKPTLLNTIETSLNFGNWFPPDVAANKKASEFIDNENQKLMAQQPHDKPITISVSDKPPETKSLFNPLKSLHDAIFGEQILSPIPDSYTQPKIPSPSPTVKATPTTLPTATLTPTPTKAPAVQQQGLPPGVKSTRGVVPSEPPPEISSVIDSVFGNKAPIAKIVAFSENGRYNPTATNTNTDGSVDVGIFQINSNTFADYVRRMPQVLESLGINSFDDMKDPKKNAQMAALIHKYQGWNAWYGPRNRGFVIE